MALKNLDGIVSSTKKVELDGKMEILKEMEANGFLCRRTLSYVCNRFAGMISGKSEGAVGFAFNWDVAIGYALKEFDVEEIVEADRKFGKVVEMLAGPEIARESEAVLARIREITREERRKAEGLREINRKE
jgi:hypothetical protein